MNLEQLSDKLLLPVLAGKSPEVQRKILMTLRRESTNLRALVWIDQQLAKVEFCRVPAETKQAKSCLNSLSLSRLDASNSGLRQDQIIALI